MNTNTLVAVGALGVVAWFVLKAQQRAQAQTAAQIAAMQRPQRRAGTYEQWGGLLGGISDLFGEARSAWGDTDESSVPYAPTETQVEAMSEAEEESWLDSVLGDGGVS